RRLLAERRTRDMIWLKNGDQLTGNLTHLGAEELHLEVNKKTVKVDRDKIAVIALNNELARTLKPNGSYGFLVLSDGTRLSLTMLVSSRPQHLRGNTLFGALIIFPLEHLIALDIRGGKATYLSDLKPKAYQYTPFLSEPPYPWVADGNVSGDE